MILKIKKVISTDILVYLISFLTNIIIVRALSASDFGVWAIYLMILQYLDTFLRPKMDLSMPYFVGKDIMRISNLLILSLSTLIIIAFFTLLAVWFAPEYLLGAFSLPFIDQNKSLLFAIIIYWLIHATYLCFLYSLTALKRYQDYNQSILIYAFLHLLIISILSQWDDFQITDVLASMYFSLIISFLYAIKKLYPYFEWSPPFQVHKVKALFQNSSNFYFSGLFFFANENITKHIAIFYLTPLQFAWIWQGYGLALLLTRLVTSLSVVLYSEMALKSTFESAKIHLLYFRSVLLLLLPLCIFISIYSDFIINLAYGANYIGAAVVLKYCVWGAYISSISSVFRNHFFSSGTSWKLVRVLWIPLFIQLAFSLYFIQKYNFSGVIVSLIFAQISFSILTIFVFIKNNECSVSEFIPRKPDLIRILKLLKLGANHRKR